MSGQKWCKVKEALLYRISQLGEHVNNFREKDKQTFINLQARREELKSFLFIINRIEEED